MDSSADSTRGLFDRPGRWAWLGRYLWSCRSLGERVMGVTLAAAFLVWLVGGLLPVSAVTSAALYEVVRAATLAVMVAWSATWVTRWRRYGADSVSRLRLSPAAQWTLRISSAVVMVVMVVLSYSGATITPVVAVSLATSGPTLPVALTAALITLTAAAVCSALTLVVVESVRTSRGCGHRGPERR